MAKGEGAESGSAAGLLPTSILQTTERPAQVKKEPKKKKQQLSVCNKLCYALGGAPYQVTGCALGFFLQIYLLDVAQVGPFSASIILFVGRAWDAITDPLVGLCISKSPWTCLGRLMPWIIFSTPLAVIAYFLIWFVPDFPDGQTYWYLLFYCLFETMVTCFHVPYSALTMFISTEQTERDSATAYRMTVEVLGTVLGTAIQGQIVGQADTPCFQDLNSSTVASQSANHTHGTTSHRETQKAYLLAAGVIVCIYIICAVILILGVREQREPYEAQQAEPIAYFRGLRLVMSHGPYIKLITGFLFTSLAFMLVEGNFVLFCTYTLGFRNEFQNLLLAIMLSATFTIPIWQWFLTRFGKKTAVYVGISSAVPFLILVALMESNLIITYVVAVAAGISVAAAFLLPWSMLPDVIDDFHLKQPHFHGTEPIFFSFYVFFTKFASGVSLGISTLSLDFAGYQTRGCSQPERVKFTLNMLVTMAPIVLILLGLLLFKMYPIDEERRRQNKKALQALRDEASSSGCSETDSTELASIL
ncbi:sodium-dependent lysophosphatidylcholine symporter 1 isoform X1 [Pongo pygmaeus]|uniref:Sodium-dependent lysophosphatidylcholine symporter 1 n=1 Tax=Pongo abelii TaxID=9601 RepID=A0A663DBA4_PONAB|nr:sodium-dependent lysophosphatidylcholine symporter 1 isoform X1 [Pongo abelii]XP_054352605.1 sodium-dependent lysophosphatidylcholine symporter 1 isoform X1 [Pongo pygmaeus]PNJ89788.1 MFSD2A isoform 3 [Pongo abelii]